MGFYFTTGQAAGELNVSSQTIRNLCASGQITAERSAGGHYRIAPAELERLKALESLPAAARATIRDPGSGRAKRNPHELLAPPSDEVIESAECAFVSDRQLAIDTNQLQRLRIRKESLELSDYFEDRQQHRRAQEIEQERREAEFTERQRQQQEAESAAEERRRFNLEWFAHALTTYKPGDAPSDYALVIQDDLFSTLNKLDPTTSVSVVEACVNASIARSLQPSRAARERSLAEHAAITRAISNLPVRMQWDDDWLTRARKHSVHPAPWSSGGPAEERMRSKHLGLWTHTRLLSG
jgi:excisionase family DNA binding protein